MAAAALIAAVGLAAGCGQSQSSSLPSSENQAAEIAENTGVHPLELLQDDPNADYLIADQAVWMRAEDPAALPDGADDVREKIGSIIATSTTTFDDWTATQLPANTEVYATGCATVLRVGNDRIAYVKMVEG